jgi:hypothetical protein
MIDLLLQVGYILLVLAVISLFVCTLPVLVDRAGGRPFVAVIGSSPKETNDTTS